MSASLRRIALGSLLALTLAATGTACGGSDDGSAGGLEMDEITVGTMPVADTAPLQLAVSKGLFEKEGLKVKLQTIAGGAEAIPKLKSGALDVSFGNYVSLLQANANGVLKPRILAEGFEGASNTHSILVLKDSPIRTAKDLAGKKIGVNTKRNVSTLLVQAGVQPAGIKLDEDKSFVEMPFPNMEAALKSKSVDAVQAVEPFVTQIQTTLGGRIVLDLSQGSMAKFPIAGYASTAEWAEKNPKTVAAFQRGLIAGQKLAQDLKTVQEVLPTYTKIDSKVAATLNMGGYPTSLSATRLQRVPDVMQQYGYLSEPVDIKTLLPSGSE